MYKYIIVYIAVMSVVDLMLYVSDKVRARKGRWRIPEKVLLGVGFLGGAAGGLLGMLLLRHKTRHWYFYLINIVALLLHAGGTVAAYLYL